MNLDICHGLEVTFVLCINDCIYVCAVSPEGSVEVEAMNGTLLYDPNEPAILTCTARGGPSNTYTWFFNGGLIENERIDTLNLDEVEGGNYVCQVSNAAGSGSANIVLTGKDSHSVMYIHYNHSKRDLKKFCMLCRRKCTVYNPISCILS